MESQTSIKMLCRCITLSLALILPTSGFAAGPRLQVLHSFAGGSDGSSPSTALVADSSGNLYGTTGSGGSNNSCFGNVGCGVIFELSPPKQMGGAWKETILYRFAGGSDGAIPAASLILDSIGNLYGTTLYGGDLTNQSCASSFYDPGCGVVFELSPQQGGGWNETVLYTFEAVTDGAFPRGSLVLDASGNLYGTTSAGGTGTDCATNQLPGCGTIFQLSPGGSGSWTETTIYQFQGLLDGGTSEAGMVFDQEGNLYGTTILGGTQGYGNVFELSPPQQQGGSWQESSLYSFTKNASQARYGVIFDPEGTLYGTTTTGNGTVFELWDSGGVWAENTIYSFTGGRFESLTGGLVLDKSGSLYGASSGPSCGAVYRLENRNDQWTEAELVFTKEVTEPCGPNGALTFGKWAAVYGTSSRGGTCKGINACGTVFGLFP